MVISHYIHTFSKWIEDHVLNSPVKQGAQLLWITLLLFKILHSIFTRLFKPNQMHFPTWVEVSRRWRGEMSNVVCVWGVLLRVSEFEVVCPLEVAVMHELLFSNEVTTVPRCHSDGNLWLSIQQKKKLSPVTSKGRWNKCPLHISAPLRFNSAVSPQKVETKLAD